MIFLIIMIIFAYIIFGAITGGFYYYLMYKNTDCSDLEDMAFMPIWIAIFWPAVAPIAFAIYFARKSADEEDRKG